MVADQQRRIEPFLRALRHGKRPVCTGAKDSALIQIRNVKIVPAVVGIVHEHRLRARVKRAGHRGVDIARHQLPRIIIFRVARHYLSEFKNARDPFRIHRNIYLHFVSPPAVFHFLFC